MRLETENLSSQYDNGDRSILNHLNPTLGSGEYLGLTAPSGFGKATCCEILAGCVKPDEGDIYIDEVPLSSFRGYCPVQMVWQYPKLPINPKLKIREVLKGDDRLEQRMIDSLGIEKDWLDRYPGEPLGGELQRFCIARAPGERTRLLPADETNAMLDLTTQSQVRNFLMGETRKREIGPLVISHSEEPLERVCTKIRDLREGS